MVWILIRKENEQMSLPEATLNCPICDSPEHTLFPILEGT